MINPNNHDILHCGMLPVYKPAGISSFDVIRQLRKVLGKVKMGHAGTLDQPASGLLLVCFGKMTKLITVFQSMEKYYRTAITFGYETDTCDETGKVVAACDAVPENLIETVREKLPLFTGDIQQIPPAFSALKISGKRAYQLAREGHEVVMPLRQVSVRRFDLLSFDGPCGEFAVYCSKGTYIRSLARDLGRAVGCYGVMKRLERCGIGPFTLDRSLRLDSLDRDTVMQSMLNITEALRGFPVLVYDSSEMEKIKNGIMPDDIPAGSSQIYLLQDRTGDTGAIVEVESGVPRFITVFNG